MMLWPAGICSLDGDKGEHSLADGRTRLPAGLLDTYMGWSLATETDMTPTARISDHTTWKALAWLVLLVSLWPGSAAFSAEEPDLIFRRSTVFKWLTPNDKLATYGLDDPEVEGVACHFTVPERGGVKGWLGVAEEVSDISLACRQIGPIHFKGKSEQGEDMFRNTVIEHALAADRALLLRVERGGVVLEILDQRAGLGALVQDLGLAFVDLAAASHAAVP